MISLEAALARARKCDETMRNLVGGIHCQAPKKEMTSIRAYLQARRDEGHRGCVLEAKIKLVKSDNETAIVMGPSIDKGPTDGHFVFRSGARLSFQFTLQEWDHKPSLITYRFDYRWPQDQNVFRFEMALQPHPDCLKEPLAHVHCGFEALRLPCGPLHPIEILDLLFFVVDPELA